MAFRGGRHRPGQTLRAGEVNDLFDAEDRLSHFQVSGGMTTVTDAGVIVTQQPEESYGFWDKRNAGQSFIARIGDHGPFAQPDYEDSRYWVEELFETSPPGVTAETATVHDRLVLKDDPLTTDDQPPYPTRWITATNLAEWQFDDTGRESHALPTDGSVVLRVRSLLPTTGVPTFYFRQEPPATIFIVVRNVLDGASDVIQVQEVKRVTEVDREGVETFVLRIVGEMFPIFVWPGFKSYHYEGHVWLGETLQDEAQVIRADRVGSFWQAMQVPRWRTRVAPTGMRVTDCSLVAYLSKGLTSLFGRLS